MEGKSRQGGQKTRYKDYIKAWLKSSDIDFETWETLALDRPAWRSKINKEAVIFDQNRMAEAQSRCELRKSKVISPPPAQFTSVRNATESFASVLTGSAAAGHTALNPSLRGVAGHRLQRQTSNILGGLLVCWNGMSCNPSKYKELTSCVSALASATPRREKTSLITEYRPDIQTWVRNFYNDNVSRCVLHNGHASEFFGLRKSRSTGLLFYP